MKKSKVAERVAEKLARVRGKAPREGVMPLNPGFFRLEAMRSEKAAKLRGVARRKVRQA